MSTDPYLNCPDESKAYRYVNQHHYRGRTVHCDLRFQTDQDFLIGWTLLDGITDEIKDAVMTLKDARELDTQDIFKIDWKKGKVKQREIKGGAVRPADIRAVEKKPEPLAWLEVEGVTPPGSVGATREFPGVFHIIDRGVIEYGTQKAYFHEYFLSRGKLKGRIAFRMIGRELEQSLAQLDGNTLATFYQARVTPVTEGLLPPGIEEEEPRVPYYWVLMQPVDQTPYVLSKGAIDKNWLPPKGTSALPRAFRKNVPKRLQFWNLPKQEALQARKELAAMEELVTPTTASKVPESKAEFVLQHHWWRGQIVVRFGPSTEHWDLRILHDKKIWHLVLKNNPLGSRSVMGYEKPCTDLSSMEKGRKETEELEPGTEWNPTKDTPAFIKALDSGNCVILEDEDLFKKVDFKGKELKGVYVFTREDPDSDFWVMSVSDLTKIEARFTIKRGGNNMATELTLETEEQKVAQAEESVSPAEQETPNSPAGAKKPSQKATEALKEALGILKPFKDDFSARVKRAIDTIAGAAGYGYPEPYKYPAPAEYPKPYPYPEPKEFKTPPKAAEAIKKALDILKPFKDEYSTRVKYSIDVLAGAAGYGYPKPFIASSQLDNTSLLQSDEPTHSLEVTIIKPGPTLALIEGKPIIYPEVVLKESIPLWDGAAAFCDHFNKSVRNIVGVYYQPWWDDGIKAKLRILDDNFFQFLSQLIADRTNNLPVPDIGISADLQVDLVASDGSLEATDILRVNSADIVFSPAAGGSFDRVLNAAGISLPQSAQNVPESGSSPRVSEGAKSEEELVPVSRVRDLQSTADKLRADLSQKDSLTLKLQAQVDNDVSKYRDVLVKANPLIPEELIQGASTEELDASISKAHQVVEKVKSNIEESTRIPAGAPVRSGPDLSEMSPSDKIRYGLAHPPK